MMIASYVPDLTVEEAKRFWMTPVELCRLAAVGEHSDPKIKKLLNTLSDRNHVPFIKSGEARTAPRLYSLESAAMLRTIAEVIEDGRTYVFAEAVAQTVVQGLCAALDRVSDLGELELKFGESRVLFSGIREDGTPNVNKWVRRDVRGGWAFAYSFFDGAYLIQRICATYADFWAADLEANP